MAVFWQIIVFKTLARSLAAKLGFPATVLTVNFVEPVVFCRWIVFFGEATRASHSVWDAWGGDVETALLAWADFGGTKCSQHAEGLHTYGIQRKGK